MPLIAETGGQNALIVDSSALPEQVVLDVLMSAFDSAGQRCSALRVLCLQEEIADRVLEMLRGALAELTVGNPDRLATDVGPVITEEARQTIQTHIEAMRGKGHKVEQAELPPAARHGTFVAPALIEIGDIGELEREVFGPVLHVVRYRRPKLKALVEAINGTGYGLTFGVHSRIDETIAKLTAQAEAGNIYVNRNLIGAVVGVQPFGGRGLSGTGPKAGGPLYLHRLLSRRPADKHADLAPSKKALAPALAYRDWLAASGKSTVAETVTRYIDRSLLGASVELPGPVGERNLYSLTPRGTIACLTQGEEGLLCQVGAALATGNRALVPADRATLFAGVPDAVKPLIQPVEDVAKAACAALLFEGDSDALMALNRALAERPGAIVPVHGVTRADLAEGRDDYPLFMLLEERAVSINTAAAGGNASLMTIG